MVRKYRKKVGPGRRQNYNPVYFQNALKEIKRGRLSIRQASEQFAVPYTTLQNALKGNHPLKMGRPIALSQEEEQHLVEGLLTCARWGFPLQSTDVRNIVQMYLNNAGKIEKRFKDNRPGLEYVRAFFKRNPALTLRLSENVKRARASVTRDTIRTYFQNLAASLENVPASHVVNYDETNFTDDPGQVKVIVKRGVKHAERIKDTSKTSISVMMAAAADGTLLPPYTVYKSKHIYPTWTEGGMPGAGYNRNQSGWFDLTMFQDWFLNILLPYFRRLPDGPKVMIGDNLSSHLSPLVIRQCQLHNIKFILLPPNSTHICQPLDVAFFRPMKIAWRQVLDKWKSKNRGVLPKAEFPRLLKEAIETIGLKVETNIKAGFKKTGIFPLDESKVLNQIPENSAEENSDPLWTRAFADQLEQTRYGTPSTSIASKKLTRGKRMDVQPGKGVVVQDDEQEATILENSSSESEQELETDPEPEEDVDEEEDVTTHEEEDRKAEKEMAEAEEVKKDTCLEVINSGDFVLIRFPTNKRQRKFVGRIEETDSEKYVINFLRKKINSKDKYFYFPEVADIKEIDKTDIVHKLRARSLRRGRYVFSEIESDVE